jgi:deoxyribonuclease V
LVLACDRAFAEIVAEKTAFVADVAPYTATHAIQVVRGRATRPLYVTAAGIPVTDAAAVVREMSGAAEWPQPG